MGFQKYNNYVPIIVCEIIKALQQKPLEHTLGWMTSIFCVHISDISNSYLRMFCTDHAGWWPGGFETFFRLWTQQNPVVHLVATRGAVSNAAFTSRHPAPSARHRPLVSALSVYQQVRPHVIVLKGEDSSCASERLEERVVGYH